MNPRKTQSGPWWTSSTTAPWPATSPWTSSKRCRIHLTICICGLQVHLEHKAKGGPLAQLAMFTKARLSVQPITGQEWDFILQMEDKK